MKFAAILATACLAIGWCAEAARADSYPVSGRWGVSASTEKGPIDCGSLRVIAFNGNQRTDSKGGVPSYRNRTVRQSGAGQYSVVDEFSTGQIGNAHVEYTLRQTDTDRLQLVLQKGGTLNLRKCK